MAEEAHTDKMPISLSRCLMEAMAKHVPSIAPGQHATAAAVALEAIYAPTELMLTQAARYGYSRDAALGCWTMMVDAALAELSHGE